MPIRMIDRNGPPEAMMLPAFLCAHCWEPVIGREGAAYWYTSYSDSDNRPISSPVNYAHRGHCFVQIIHGKPKYAGMLMDMRLDEFLEALAHFGTEGFKQIRNVEYVAPKPSTWRLGRYHRRSA